MAIYDCFTFFNEIELLKFRLEFLYPYVDKFVIVELRKNHRGEDKPLYFKNSIDVFSEYMDKIIYLSPDMIPEYSGDGDWTIANYPRNCIAEGILRCKSEDIIMISDLDEIPNPLVFSSELNIKICHKGGEKIGHRIKMFNYIIAHSRNKMIIEKLLGHQKKMDFWLDSTPIVLQQKLFYYYMNYQSPKFWYGTVLCKFKNMSLPQTIRNSIFNLPYVTNGGWHFSYLGGVERIKYKINSIVEGRDLLAKVRDNNNIDEYIKECLKTGKDVYGRKEMNAGFHKIALNEIGISDIEKTAKNYPDFFMPDE